MKTGNNVYSYFCTYASKQSEMRTMQMTAYTHFYLSSVLVLESNHLPRAIASIVTAK